MYSSTLKLCALAWLCYPVEGDFETEYENDYGAGVGIRYLFRCPPSNSWYSSRAYRVAHPGGFSPILASLKPKSTKAKLAIIPIHGLRFEQEDFFQLVANGPVKKYEKVAGSTVVVAPAFQRTSCYANQWPPNKAVGKIPSPTWSSSGHTFFTGTNGTEKDEFRMSSFKVLDSVVVWTADNYPNLEMMVVTGFSAGSQMALNWAIMSAAGTDGVVHLHGYKIPLRIIVQSPGSVTYMDEKRPNRSCIKDADTGLFHTCTSFKLPYKTCKHSYDNYQHGTDGFEKGGKSSLTYPGVAGYLSKEMGINDDYRQRIVDRFGTKEIYYQVGDKDTGLCSKGVCSSSCGSDVTGSNRQQRMQNFMGYLAHLFQERALPDSIEFGTFHGGHDSNAGFWSPWFILWTFKATYAPKPPASLPDLWTKYDGTNCYNGRGAKQILVDSFVYQRKTVEGCQEACQQQKRPLCEGVVVRPGKTSQDCWLVSDVQLSKCKKEGGYTFYHLTEKSYFHIFQLSTTTSPVLGTSVLMLVVCSLLAGTLLLRSGLLRVHSKNDDIQARRTDKATEEEEMRLLAA